MSQRAGVVTAGSRDQQQSQTQQVPENHLMPPSLRRIPNWFQPSRFQYNIRFMIAFLPGALLVATVTGKLMIGAVILGVVISLLLKSSDQKYLAMMASIAHMFALAVLNVYCMAPIIWQSILNFPLFFIIHAFIATSAFWWLMQDSQFIRQDPRFTILVERMLFAAYPAVSVVMVTWVCAMLFGMTSIPISVSVSGLIGISLFVSPLKSSFAKPTTPTNSGLIQHWAVAVVYITLEMTVPPLLYITVFHHVNSFTSWMYLSLLVLGPVFILTLLESQGLLSWLYLSSTVVLIMRCVSGGLVMLLLALLAWQSSSLLSLLLIPLIFSFLIFLSSLDTSPSPTAIALGLSTAIFSSFTFFFLPWSISQSFSLLQLPLSLLQILIWCITMATIVMVIFHKQITATVWILFNIMYVVLEYVMSWDGVYPHHLAMLTTSLAAILFWRLYVAGRLSPEQCLLLISLHLTKLSLLLPSSPYISSTSSMTSCLALFLVSFLILRILLFSSATSSPLSPGQLLVFCGLLCCGLLMSVDSILTPLWLSISHQPPASPSILAMISGGIALYMIYGLDQMRPGDVGRLSYFPPALIIWSLLLFYLQPQFDPRLMIETVGIALSSSTSDEIPSDIRAAAWGHLFSWAVLGSAVLLAVTIVTDMLVPVSAAVLGGALGAMATITLMATPPSLEGTLYIVAGGVTGHLIGRAYATPTKQGGRSLLDNILFSVLVVVMATAFITECFTSSHEYIPNMSWIERLSVPSTRLGMIVFGSISFTFRIKMSQCGEQCYVSMAANASCILFFLLALLNPLHIQYEISVVLVSLIFLLLQPDGYYLPKTSSLFLAPSLLAASLLLYFLAGHRILSKILTLAFAAKTSTIFLATRCLELLCLITSLPGQGVFLYYLWTGRQLHLSTFRLVLLILPNAFLPQFSGAPSSTILGIIGVLSCCLIMLGDYSGLKLYS